MWHVSISKIGLRDDANFCGLETKVKVTVANGKWWKWSLGHYIDSRCFTCRQKLIGHHFHTKKDYLGEKMTFFSHFPHRFYHKI